MLPITISHFVFPVSLETEYQVAEIGLVKLKIRRKIDIVRIIFTLFRSSTPGYSYLSHFSLGFVTYGCLFAKKLGSRSGNLLTFGKRCNDNCQVEYATKITKMESRANGSYFSLFCDHDL
jgi:hypothetical protein